MNHKVLFSKIIVIPMCLLLALTSVSKPFAASADDSLELSSTPTLTPTATVSPTPTMPPLPSVVKIGVVYPLSGRLAKNNWGPEGVPFWEKAEEDINNLSDTIAKGIQFKLVVETSDSTPEGAQKATNGLIGQGIQAIVGYPVTYELMGSIELLTQNKIAAISSTSSGPQLELRQVDTVYRTMPGELYLARKLADLLMELGYSKAAIIYRNDGWGDLYAEEFAARFAAQGYPTESVAIPPTHPYVTDYKTEVALLSTKVANLGAGSDMAVVLVVWEGEDLNILHHAATDKTLSSVRWFSALAGPALLQGTFGGVSLPDASYFAYEHELWTQENHPPENELVLKLLDYAEDELGREPRFEHVYMYDAVQLMARAILLAGTYDGTSIAAKIPQAAQSYQAATGPISFDANGDRASGDLAYTCLVQSGSVYEYYYSAFYHDDPFGGYFDILGGPEPRDIQWCPEC